jgi:FixJ family two-component response regulator
MTAIAETPTRRARILLVEDDAAVRRALHLLLTAGGHEVRAYPSAIGLATDQEALAADCLIADLVMPNMDGIELLRSLYRVGWKGPAILISGHLTDEWERRASEQGYDAIFGKPLAEAALIGCVSRLLVARRPPN